MNEPILSIRDVHKTFGGLKALDGVEFDVAEGSITGVIGPNGAGKTTLFDCVSGFQVPDRGSIRLHLGDGSFTELVDRAPWERAALGVGRTFQNSRLFRSMPLSEILRTVQHDRMRRSGFFRSVVGAAGARADESEVGSRAQEVLELVGLADHADKPPVELSTGMLRLAELGAAVALRPRLLVLDEPASGIAQKEVEALGPLLRRLAHHLGATLLVIEHDVPLIMGLADEIVAMAEGRVLTVGTPAEVQRHDEVLRSYLGSVA